MVLVQPGFAGGGDFVTSAPNSLNAHVEPLMEGLAKHLLDEKIAIAVRFAHGEQIKAERAMQTLAQLFLRHCRKFWSGMSATC